MGKIDWPRWNEILNYYSYLYLVGSISATSLSPVLATLLCFILLFIFHFQTLPEVKKIFSRRQELKRLKEQTGLTSEEMAELRKLLEERNSLTVVYLLSMLTSVGLGFYNLFRMLSN